MRSEDTLQELQKFVRRILELDENMTTVDRRKNYEEFLSRYADLEDCAWDQGYRLNGPEITGRVLEDISMITVFCRNLDDILEKEKPLRRFGLENEVHEIAAGTSPECFHPGESLLDRERYQRMRKIQGP